MEEMLEKLDDPHLVRIITNRLFDFRRQCKCLREHVVQHDRAFAIEMLHLCKHKSLEKMAMWSDKMPHGVYSHWQCCLIAIYRNTLDIFWDFPTKRQVQVARLNPSNDIADSDETSHNGGICTSFGADPDCRPEPEIPWDNRGWQPDE
jgi:hypothetical protein